MKIIGVTGKSGSGKTTALRYMQTKGVDIIDGDEVSRGIYVKNSTVYKELVAEFGDKILGADGEIDRAALGAAAFSDPARLKALNEITHKYILKEIEGRILASGGDVVAVEGGALIESGFWQRCDYRLVILADGCLDRIVERDKISKAAAKQRLCAQKDDSFYTAEADCVIYNSGTLSELYKKIDAVLAEVRG